MRLKFLGLAAVAAFLLVSALIVLHFRPDTSYAKDFRHEKFMGLHLGASMSDVVGQLGRPISQTTIQVQETWVYGLRETPPDIILTTGIFNSSAVIAPDPPRLVFDSAGRVAELLGDHSAFVVTQGVRVALGASKDEVLSAFGQPVLIRLPNAYTHLFYTRPNRRGATFKSVIMVFDAKNRLVEKQAAMDWD